MTAAHAPSSKTRREVRILCGVQTGIEPPSFMLFTNVASELHFSYERYLMNQLREDDVRDGLGWILQLLGGEVAPARSRATATKAAPARSARSARKAKPVKSSVKRKAAKPAKRRKR